MNAFLIKVWIWSCVPSEEALQICRRIYPKLPPFSSLWNAPRLPPAQYVYAGPCASVYSRNNIFLSGSLYVLPPMYVLSGSLVPFAAFAGEWPRVMDSWGQKMLGTVAVVAEVVARGFGLQADAFTRRMQYGPHLLAPTGMSQLVCTFILSRRDTCSPELGRMQSVRQALFPVLF
jgi:hypothetical protein